MQKLSLILTILFVIARSAYADSPHGKDFKINCNVCHNSNGWGFDRKASTFNHNTTAFPLEGQHIEINCRTCHQSLVFSETKKACVDCHKDIHNQSNRLDCSRCHTPKSWIITDATAIHQQSRFPLVGAHKTADCYDCHKSGSLQLFNPVSTACIDCHRQQYLATSNPNHAASGFSTECLICHKLEAFQWGSGGFDHSFFPLTLGHNITDCSKCHKNGSFTPLPTDCYSCHSANYASANDPSHQGFPTNCIMCHTTNPGWQPANFDHNTTTFPLTGAHLTTACIKCHANGYAGTTHICEDCHTPAYMGSLNPNHVAIGIPNTCGLCHTTNPGWAPATFPIHNNYWVITGAHLTVPSCANCHNGNYINTPNTCIGCHQTTYNQTNNPAHASAQFPTDCLLCHNQNAWSPSTFNHDQQWFPIYSGKHKNEWNTCADCHTNPSNYAVFTCTTSCHPQSQTNNDHSDVSGYSYNSQACYNCHPDGSGKKFSPGKIKKF